MSSKKNLVIVDDEKDILDILQRFLSRSEKYNIKTYDNPITAMSNINENVDLVLLDVMMPQMNGLEVLAKIQENNTTTKVIIMTAYSTLDKVLESHRKGAVDYITKPFGSLKALETQIDKLLAV